MSQNRIDVVMSAYNSARYLPAALDSILSQTIEDFRLIVVDDGSTDETPRILAEYAGRDGRVVVISQANQGIVAAVNAGMAIATAPYIARHDADDLSDPDRFEKELAWLEAHPDCVAVSSLPRTIDDNGHPATKTIRAKDMALVRDDAIPANEPYIMQPMLMVRHDALTAVGGYRNLTVSEDADLYWRLFRIGTLHVLDEPLGSYRMHGQSISSGSIINGRRLAVWSQLSALSAQRLRKNEPDIDFSEALRKRLDQATTLQEMLDIIAPQCNRRECSWLAVAMAAKLLETCYYRAYEPDRSDIAFILKAISQNPEFCRSPESSVFRESVLSAGIRLLVSGEVRNAFTLVAPRLWLKLMARAAFRVLLSDGMKSRIKAMVPKKLVYGHG